MKFILLTLLTWCATFQSLQLNMGSLASFKANLLKKKKAETTNKILFQGWVKYFHYSSNSSPGKEESTKPKTFFKNTQYEKQQNPKSSDQYGSWSIPSEKHFFAVVYEDDVNFLTSREYAIGQWYDTLHIDFIKSIPEDNKTKGGVKEWGKFKEGYCWQISTIIPNKAFVMTQEHTNPQEGIEQTWLICSDNKKEISELENTIISNKIKKQVAVGVHLYSEGDDNKREKKDNNNNNKDVNNYNPPNLKPEDGYWILWQDWSQCTLKCGGGKQVQQLSCVPPKTGGRPCEGSAIRERPCNIQPCPEPKQLSSWLSKNKSNVQENPFKATQDSTPPWIKMMPISSRPQRYDKCHLKDTDALMFTTSFNGKPIPGGTKIPVRLVMNNKSISAYQDENLASALITQLLGETKFLLIPHEDSCFKLESWNNSAVYCSLTSLSGNFVHEWNTDFNWFKYKCAVENPTIDALVEKEIEKEYNTKKKVLELEFINTKISKIKEQKTKSEEVEWRKKVSETKALTQAAVLKENKLEEMLIKEEEERQKQELEDIKWQIQQEEQKKQCMQKAIKEKEMESEVILSQEMASNEIKKIQNEAKEQIEFKRNALKETIQKMRQMFNRKKIKYQNRINVIRTETADDISKLTKKGDMEKCFSLSNDKLGDNNEIEKINMYCTINYSSNNAEFNDCKENFCHACCENEFGDAYISDRNQCILTKCTK